MALISLPIAPNNHLPPTTTPTHSVSRPQSLPRPPVCLILLTSRPISLSLTHFLVSLSLSPFHLHTLDLHRNRSISSKDFVGKVLPSLPLSKDQIYIQHEPVSSLCTKQIYTRKTHARTHPLSRQHFPPKHIALETIRQTNNSSIILFDKTRSILGHCLSCLRCLFKDYTYQSRTVALVASKLR